MNKQTLSVLAALAGFALLSGCSTAPDRNEVAERFAIELEGVTGLPRSYFEELHFQVADDLLDGMCSSDPYMFALQDPNLQYAVMVTCLMDFEDDMKPYQVERAKTAILEEISKEGSR